MRFIVESLWAEVDAYAMRPEGLVVRSERRFVARPHAIARQDIYEPLAELFQVHVRQVM